MAKERRITISPKWFVSTGVPTAKLDAMESPTPYAKSIQATTTPSNIMSKKAKAKSLGGMPHVVDGTNRIVYINCTSAIMAMGISAFMKRNYPGYEGQLVSADALARIKEQLES